METVDRGRFVWHELNTTDPAAGERFYRALTGWGMQAFEQMPSYRMWTDDGVPQGGLMLLPDEAKKMGAPAHWLSYAGVPNVDASVRLASSLGGRALVAPQDIPGGGRFAVLADPQGAVFALHASSQPMAPESAPKVGEFSWHELATTDPDAAWRFYESLFGWKKMEAMQTPMGLYQMFGRGAFMYGGIYTKPAASPASPNWLAYIKVASVDAATPKATSLGGRILAGPMDVPGGDRIVMCVDPQGAAFSRCTPRRRCPPRGRRRRRLSRRPRSLPRDPPRGLRRPRRG
ncbi:MAG: VOC family protein [Gemmatimonadetes bacterium]|nr:VOC family protein [Gemmatimonadota bacterium]